MTCSVGKGGGVRFLPQVLVNQFTSIIATLIQVVLGYDMGACTAHSKGQAETAEDKIFLEGPICLKNDEVTSIDPLLLARKYS